MKKLMISSDSSGGGKTTVTIGLLRCLGNMGYSVEAAKCGPDYIDPMFHERVLGVKSRNLDTFLMGEEKTAREAYKCACADILIAEGAMGYYDGLGGSDKHSAYHIAKVTDMPVLLVINPKAQSLTLAAVINGIRDFRKDSGIAGVLLNKCSEKRYDALKKVIEDNTGLPVVGYLPDIKEAEIESRYLGLLQPGEIDEIDRKVDIIAEQIKKTADIELLMGLMKETGETFLEERPTVERKCRIAVAKDEAFSFYYRSSIEALKENGAELVYFSLINDESLPKETDALYIGGGYPELYAKELSENVKMKDNISNAIADGMPTIAECGGFLYLGNTLEGKDGVEYKMTGVLESSARDTKKSVRFGYGYLKSKNNNMLFNKEEKIPIHEFHYWDTNNNGCDGTVEKPWKNISYECGFINNTMYAGFPHLSLEGEIPLAERFINAACNYKNGAGR